MIVTFKSPAAGDVIMFADVAHLMMEIMGKDATATGIVTIEQLPAAIARLRAAVVADKARRANLADEDPPHNEATEDGDKHDHVSLAQRAVPLLELLEWSLKKNKPVTWGV
ncbi:conserved protein of unknown function [Georgfuchsia toluolica]|uniref:DUF1840 domain-containing protein n=1 Tax=Georgfuchsia toluolica TaxID=424218 RepID=A0A916J7Y3_9PROT|nr:DUF1840 domain-containing protein [Georgfuchsia toluolica]CAG4884835.1 conserved protein of unknown function [Georgfuchsia toluolica]